MTIVKKFSGNSGSIVELHESSGYMFVRKKSLCDDQDIRLAEQVDLLPKLDNDFLRIKTPIVYCIGSTEDQHFFYDMQYIQGISFAQYTTTQSVKNICLIFERILLWITLNSKVSLGKFDLSANVNDKLDSLNKILEFDNEMTHAIQLLHMKNQCVFDLTLYHGDLTFENIIVDADDQIWLIDPLDSYNPCFLADLTKLNKELYCFWSQINSGIQINPGIYAPLREMLLNNGELGQYHYYMLQLVAIDLLRTLPYLKHANDSRARNIKKALLTCLMQ